MLAKIIVHASDRKAAIARMLRVLEASICLGVGTNISFMAACLEHPSFKDGSYTTALIPSNIDALLARPAVIAQRALLGAPSTSGAAIPIHAIAPAWAFFYRLRRLFSPLRAGLRPGWRLHGQDHAQVQAESYEVTLPDAGGRFDVMLEYVPGGGDTFELRMWSNTADKTEETVLATQLERAKQKKGSKAKATPTLTQERAAAVARYYASRPTRAGVEGRESSSKWAFGVQPDVVFRTNVSVVDAELSVHASAGHNQRWAHGTLRLEVAGRTTTHVLASDETFDAPDSGAQTAWSWVTALAGPVKVVRRSMLVYAGRLDSATAGAVADGMWTAAVHRLNSPLYSLLCISTNSLFGQQSQRIPHRCRAGSSSFWRATATR